eukprot:4672058-Amphidinium_carterae.1
MPSMTPCESHASPWLPFDHTAIQRPFLSPHDSTMAIVLEVGHCNFASETSGVSRGRSLLQTSSNLERVTKTFKVLHLHHACAKCIAAQ